MKLNSKLKRKLQPQLILPAVLAGLLIFPKAAIASSSAAWKWQSFGVSERFLFQPSYSGVNYSGMLNWYPEYRFSQDWSAIGFLGVGQLKGSQGYFTATRATAGFAYHAFSLRWIPEIQLGFENWPSSNKGNLFTTSFNIHYRILSKDKHLKYVDSLWLGWQTIAVPSDAGNSAVMGVRFSIPQGAAEPSSSVSPSAELKDQSALPRKKPTATVDGILFKRSRLQLKPQFHSKLDQFVEEIKGYPDAQIEVQGHTDDYGTAKVNRLVSLRRAESVKKYLVEKGIPSNRIQVVGYGTSRPLSSEKTEAGRLLNRRVEVILIDEK